MVTGTSAVVPVTEDAVVGQRPSYGVWRHRVAEDLPPVTAPGSIPSQGPSPPTFTSPVLAANWPEDLGPVIRGWLAGQLDAFGAAGAVVCAVSEGGEKVEPRWSVGYPREVLASWPTIPLTAATPLTTAVRTGRTVVVADAEDLAARFPLMAAQPTSGYLCSASVPLRGERGEVIGVLGLSFPSPVRLQAARPALNHLGTRLAARLHGASPDFAGVQAPRAGASRPPDPPGTDPSGVDPDGVLPGGVWHLHELAEHLVTALAPEQVLDVVTHQAEPLLGATMVAISVYDSDQGLFRLVTSRAMSSEARHTYATYSAEPGLPAGDALRADGIVLLHDVAERDARYPRFAHLAMVEEAWATLVLPGPRGPLGIVTFGFPRPQRFASPQVEMLREVARMTAAALERAAAYEAEQAARREAETSNHWLRALQRTNTRLAQATQPQDVMDAVLEAAAENLGASAAILVEYDATSRVATTVVAVGVSDPLARVGVRVPIDQFRMAQDLVATAEPLIVTSPEDLAARYPGTDPGLPQEAWAGVPFVVDGQVIGWASFGWDAARTFSDAEIGYLNLLGAAAAIAFDRARLLTQALGTAERLQRALLPELTRTPGWEFAGLYLPAVHGTEVGGDWFDAFTLPDGRVGLVVGDVAGKGIPAATVMGAARSALRAFATLDADPDVVLSRVDSYLATFKPEVLITCLFGVLDPDTGQLRYSCAGHLPALLVTAGQSRWLDENVDPPLGVPDAGPRRTAHLVLPESAVLLLYTDGIVERRRTGLEPGLRLLAASAMGLAGASDLPQTMAVLAASLEDPDSTGDDRALLAVRARVRTRPG